MIARAYYVHQDDSTSSEKDIYPDSTSSGIEIEERPLAIPEEEQEASDIGSDPQEFERNLQMVLSTSGRVSRWEQSEDYLALYAGSALPIASNAFASLKGSASERLRTESILRRTQIQVPTIPHQLLEKLDSNKLQSDSFSRILYRLKRKLIGVPEVIDYDVERLDDPEGSKFRVYFVVETIEISRNRRLQIRKLMGKEIDKAIMEYIEDKQLAKDLYFELRPVFGAFVEV